MHESQVSASASTLAITSVARREEISLSSPNVIAQANSEPNPAVSFGYYVLAITNEQQAEQAISGIFANAQNVLITGGTIIVSLVVVAYVISVLIL